MAGDECKDCSKKPLPTPTEAPLQADQLPLVGEDGASERVFVEDLEREFDNDPDYKESEEEKGEEEEEEDGSSERVFDEDSEGEFDDDPDYKESEEEEEEDGSSERVFDEDSEGEFDDDPDYKESEEEEEEEEDGSSETVFDEDSEGEFEDDSDYTDSEEEEDGSLERMFKNEDSEGEFDDEKESEEEDEVDKNNNSLDEDDGELGKGENERHKLQDGLYLVEQVMNKRIQQGKPQYFVKWAGWPETSNTWEPRENLLSVSNMIDEFEESLSKKEQLVSVSEPERKRKRSTNDTETKKMQQKHRRLMVTRRNVYSVEVGNTKECSKKMLWHKHSRRMVTRSKAKVGKIKEYSKKKLQWKRKHSRRRMVTRNNNNNNNVSSVEDEMTEDYCLPPLQKNYLLPLPLDDSNSTKNPVDSNNVGPMIISNVDAKLISETKEAVLPIPNMSCDDEPLDYFLPPLLDDSNSTKNPLDSNIGPMIISDVDRGVYFPTNGGQGELFDAKLSEPKEAVPAITDDMSCEDKPVDYLEAQIPNAGVQSAGLSGSKKRKSGPAKRFISVPSTINENMAAHDFEDDEYFCITEIVKVETLPTHPGAEFEVLVKRHNGEHMYLKNKFLMECYPRLLLKFYEEQLFK